MTLLVAILVIAVAGDCEREVGRPQVSVTSWYRSPAFSAIRKGEEQRQSVLMLVEDVVYLLFIIACMGESLKYLGKLRSRRSP